MSELRWILLAAGIALIAGIYFWGTRSRQRSAAMPLERSTRVEPAPAAGPPSTPEVTRVEPMLSPDDAFDAMTEDDEPAVDFDEPAISRGYGRREPTFDPAIEPPPAKTAPQFNRSAPIADEVNAEPEPETMRKPEPPAEPERPKQKIVAVRVVANPPLRFEGPNPLELIRSDGLEYGRYEILHNLHADGRPVYSLASLREPGTFDLAAM